MRRMKAILLCLLLLGSCAFAADPERKVVTREQPVYPALRFTEWSN